MSTKAREQLACGGGSTGCTLAFAVSVSQCAQRVMGHGFEIVATSGAEAVLAAAGIECRSAKQVREGRPHLVDMIKRVENHHIVKTTVGKQATLLITTGTPLNMTSDVILAYVQGREIDMNDIQKHFFKKYMEKIRQQQGRIAM